MNKNLQKFITKYKLLKKSFVDLDKLPDPLFREIFNLYHSKGLAKDRWAHIIKDKWITDFEDDPRPGVQFFIKETMSSFDGTSEKLYLQKYEEIYSNRDKYPTLIKILEGEINA